MKNIFIESVASSLRIVSPLILLAGVIFTQPANASLSIGADANVVGWEGAIRGDQYQSDNSTIQYGVNFKIKFNKLYTGADYSAGRYDFSGQDIPGDATSNPDSTVRRNEFNVVVGYYVFRHLSLFAKYKNLVFDNGEKYKLKDPGLGAQLHYTLSSHWLLFGNVARFSGDFTIDGHNDGDTNIKEYALGAAYRPALHSYISVSYRKHRLDYQYNNAGTETHTLSGLFASYNYVF